MTSFPVGVLRFAGDWSVSETYLYGMYVIATGAPYACGAVSDTGTDPTTQPSVVWFPFPSTGAGVASLQNLTGALSLQSTDSSITIVPSGSTIDLQAVGGGGGSSITGGGATVACDDPAASGSIKLTTSTNTGNGSLTIDTTASPVSGVVDILSRGTVTIDTTIGTGSGLDIKTALTSSTFESSSTTGFAGSIVFSSADLTNPATVTIGGGVNNTGLYVSNSQLLYNGSAVGGGAGVASLNTASGAVVITMEGGMGSVTGSGTSVSINPFFPASGTATTATTVAHNLTGSIAWEGTGTSTKAYNPGAMVIYSGVTYVCLVGQSVGSVPPANGANWQSIGGGGGGSSITGGGATVACDDPASSGSISLTTDSTATDGSVYINTSANANFGNVVIELGGDFGIGDGSVALVTPTTQILMDINGLGTPIVGGATYPAGVAGQISLVSTDITDPATVTIGGAVNNTGLYVSNTQLLYNGAAIGAAAIDVEGLQNKLGIIPALPHTTDVIELAINNVTPTAIVPDATTPTSSTTASGALCWLYTKPTPSNAGFNWYMYNPRFGAPAAPLPYRKYSPNPAQERIQSVWALVQPAVNTNIYTAGVIALNLYSFDDTNVPTSGFYNTRWAYSNSQGQNGGQSGTNLYAGFTYLIYAYDAPRITNQTGVGQPDIQDWGLRDPYDIYPDVNHIPLQNCVLAFNPWTDGTNYQTWTGTGVYTNGQTVIFSGFGLGGTGNGIFYTAVGAVPVNTPPVSATGVPSPFWTAISPQPSSYASQPISLMNVNGINGSTTGWTAGPLLRILSMGYTTGNNPFTQTSGVRYVLN